MARAIVVMRLIDDGQESVIDEDSGNTIQKDRICFGQPGVSDPPERTSPTTPRGSVTTAVEECERELAN